MLIWYLESFYSPSHFLFVYGHLYDSVVFLNEYSLSKIASLFCFLT